MNLQQCAQVLAKIQLGDNRQVDELTVREWFDTIGHLDFEDAIAGVKEHRQISTDYLMPAHVIGGAKRARDRRARSQRVSEAQRELGGVPDDFEGAWKRGEKDRVLVWRAMLTDPHESERTKAWIRESFQLEGIEA